MSNTAQTLLPFGWLIVQCARHSPMLQSRPTLAIHACIHACSLNYWRIAQSVQNASKNLIKILVDVCRTGTHVILFTAKVENAKKIIPYTRVIWWVSCECYASAVARMNEWTSEMMNKDDCSLFLFMHIRLNRTVCHCLDISVQQAAATVVNKARQSTAWMRVAHSIRRDS